MSDEKQQPVDASVKPKARDRSAKMIHDLATDPPPKDMASIKAASDVYEANKKDVSQKQKDASRKQREPAHH